MCSCSLVGMQFSGMTSLRSVLEEVDKAFDSITALLIRLIYVFCEIDSTPTSF